LKIEGWKSPESPGGESKGPFARLKAGMLGRGVLEG
jgi:hypothetical protein